MRRGRARRARSAAGGHLEQRGREQAEHLHVDRIARRGLAPDGEVERLARPVASVAQALLLEQTQHDARLVERLVHADEVEDARRSRRHVAPGIAQLVRARRAQHAHAEAPVGGLAGDLDLHGRLGILLGLGLREDRGPQVRAAAVLAEAHAGAGRVGAHLVLGPANADVVDLAVLDLGQQETARLFADRHAPVPQELRALRPQNGGKLVLQLPGKLLRHESEEDRGRERIGPGSSG